MKFTNISNKLGNIVIKIIYILGILLMLGIAGVLIYCDFYLSTPIFSFMWFALLPCLRLVINLLLGEFFGDKYYNSGSVYDVKKTPKYYTRRIFLCFVECLLFALLIVRFISLIYLDVACSIIGIIVSIIGIIIYFIFGMSSYEQSGLKNKNI